jgi:type I restriction enzyme S subunit
LIAQKQQRKKGLMQKLLTGEVRFPEFEETAWREVRLGDIVKPLSRKNAIGNTNVLTSSAKHGLVSQTDYFNKSVAGVNTSGYYLLKRGEFAYNRSSAKGYPYGAIKRLDFYDEGVLSTLYLCFVLREDSGVQSDFLAHLFEAGLLNHGLQSVCQQGARAHGLLNITKVDFYGLKISIPSSEEQEAIEGVLNAQFEEIALEQNKLDQLKQQKKGLMQQLLTGKVRVKV